MRIFSSWRACLIALTRRRRYAVSFLLGLLAVLALPPVHAIPVLIPAFVGLVWLIDGARTRIDAFWTGWFFGLGFFIAGLYWMSYSFLVDAATYAWLIPFAVPGLSSVAAIYIGLAAAATHWLAPAGLRRAALLPLAWVGFEYLRGILLTGFPWNLLGSVWVFSDAMLQGAALFGAYGLTLATCIAATAPAALADENARPRARWGLVGAGAAVLAVLWIGGTIRLNDTSEKNVPGVRLRLVQPDIAQNLKWVPEERAEIMRVLLRLSAQAPSGAAPTHIIWPETATPTFLEQVPDDLRVVASVAPAGGALITGSPRLRRGTGEVQLWNSIHVVDRDALIRASYDKFHLVPFGEYMPIPNFFGLRALAADRVDFSPGPGPVTMEIPGAPPASPLICYEVIFPGHVVAADMKDGPRPQWLLNVTNDAWFGISSGPYQHLASARMRAVEEGLPLVRTANNGVSGVYDAYGRVIVETELGKQAVLDADLPTYLTERTIYSRLGNWSLSVVMLIYVVVFRVFPKSRIHATIRES